jgi:hypothetical protein
MWHDADGVNAESGVSQQRQRKWNQRKQASSEAYRARELDHRYGGHARQRHFLR